MGSLSEDDTFLDTKDYISSPSNSDNNSPENSDSEFGAIDYLPGSSGYDIWIENPSSIRERRNKFLKWMGLGVNQTVEEDPNYDDTSCDEVEVDTDRIMEKGDAVLRSLSYDGELSSSLSSMPCWSSDARELLDGAMEDNFVCRIRNLDDGREFVVDEFEKDGITKRLREVGSNRSLTVEEFERILGFSPLVQKMMRREVEGECNLRSARKQVKKGWLRRLGSIASFVDRQKEDGKMICNSSYPFTTAKSRTVRVRALRKRCKELSALYMQQDISAHTGAILTMKFSPDGQYLASAGEDGIVRVWQVVESERSEERVGAYVDSSYVYFAMNNLSELVPAPVDREKKGKLKGVGKIFDSACVIFPQKIFKIVDRPIHEFHGHCGEVLDLSWSRNEYLLSSSADKTVRLWQVGCDQCLKVFTHNNYVTSVQFNPMDDNYFISGSIDGKIRIWAIRGCQVVDWTDITEIVTAICYRPDGKGLVVGSMTGNCRFYDTSDDHLQMYAQISLQGKKKSPFKRITGFQFSPSDSSKLMVTSADSQVRILNGVDVICKFRGLRNSRSQISASYTTDGMHVLSASEDSNVYMWNYISQDAPVPRTKNSWSCERFFSNNASVAISWCGMARGSSVLSSILGTSPSLFSSRPAVNLCDCSEEKGSLVSSLTKGSATWPEEKLPLANSLVVSSITCKSQCKILKTSLENTHGSPHAWGLVIVTAGWDGRIRTFQNFGLPVRL